MFSIDRYSYQRYELFLKGLIFLDRSVDTTPRSSRRVEIQGEEQAYWLIVAVTKQGRHY